MRYRMSLVTTITVFVLMMIGTIVVGLDAGMACPDWPLCNGKVIPDFEGKVIIEYIHRLVSMVVGFLVMINAWMQWKKWKGHRVLQFLALFTVPLLGIVAFLGGWNVMKQLPSGFTTIDLAVSLLLIGCLVILTTASMRTPVQSNADDHAENNVLKELYKPAILVASSVLIQNIYGGFIRHSDAGTSYFGKLPAWGTPLVGSQTVAQWMVGIHMFITFLIIISVMWLVFMAVQKKVLKGYAFSLLILLALEAVFGLISLSTELAFAVVTVHLALGTLMLMISVHIAVRASLGTSYAIQPVDPSSDKKDWKVRTFSDKPEKGY